MDKGENEMKLINLLLVLDDDLQVEIYRLGKLLFCGKKREYVVKEDTYGFTVKEIYPTHNSRENILEIYLGD